MLDKPELYFIISFVRCCICEREAKELTVTYGTIYGHTDKVDHGHNRTQSKGVGKGLGVSNADNVAL